jgi:hypothetical protein
MIAVAVGLPVWRLGWGIERQLAFPDEILRWSLHVRSFVPLSWDSFALPEPLTESNRVFVGGMVYPTLYPYLAGLATALAVAVGLIPPPVKPVYLEGILVARVVSALVSVLAVGVVSALGVRMYGRRAGLLAMAFMAVVPAEVVQAHAARRLRRDGRATSARDRSGERGRQPAGRHARLPRGAALALMVRAAVALRLHRPDARRRHGARRDGLSGLRARGDQRRRAMTQAKCRRPVPLTLAGRLP